MALTKYMAYFHYNFHCCTSLFWYCLCVRLYCGGFIFFTDVLFIMFMFNVILIDGLLQSKHSAVTIAICTALFQFLFIYCDFCAEKISLQERNELLCLCGVVCWLQRDNLSST